MTSDKTLENLEFRFIKAILPDTTKIRRINEGKFIGLWVSNEGHLATMGKDMEAKEISISFSGRYYRFYYKGAQHLAHHAIAAAWLPPKPQENARLTFLDSNPQNITISNLAWTAASRKKGKGAGMHFIATEFNPIILDFLRLYPNIARAVLARWKNSRPRGLTIIARCPQDQDFLPTLRDVFTDIIMEQTTGTLQSQTLFKALIQDALKSGPEYLLWEGLFETAFPETSSEIGGEGRLARWAQRITLTCTALAE